MATRRQKRKTKELKDNTLGVLKVKLAEMILLKEDIEMQENFAADLDEKKEVIQRLIDVTHQVSALRTVIKLFAEDEK